MESTVKQKKILILVDWFYPGYKAGGPIQSCRNFIAAMHDKFDMAVVSSDRDLGDSAAYPGIRVNQWNDYSFGTKVYYASSLSMAQLQQIQGEKQADYIYVNSMFSLRYAILPFYLFWRRKLNATLVVAPRGMLQKGAMQFKPFKKKCFLQAIKLSGIHKHMVFHATDEQERMDIQSYFPGAEKIIVATNFPKMEQPVFVAPKKREGELNIVFISRVAPKKNLDYLLSQLQHISPALKINLTIRGEAEDQSYLQTCKKLAEQLPANIKITFEGPIENDLIPACIQQHHVFVLPTRGENFGHAIFEALAAGRPVLISDQTPWRNLTGKKAGWDLSLDTPPAFTEVIEQAAAMNEIELTSWCEGARQLANHFIKESAIKEQYLKLFN